MSEPTDDSPSALTEASRGAPQVKGGLLMWLSGVDMRVLQTAPRERTKFVGVGGAVLTTSILAAVSCTFALVIGVRVPVYWAVPIGVLWGLAIMNLDRWLVTATPRRDRWFQNLVQVMPRLLLALIIGTVISTPMVLWIFQREINNELVVLQQQKASEFQHKLDTDVRYNGIPDLQKEVAHLQGVVNGTVIEEIPDDPQIDVLKKEYEKQDKDYQAKQDAATREHDGTGGTGNPGPGSDYYIKKKLADEAKARRDAAKAAYDKAVRQHASKQKEATVNARASASAELTKAQAELNRRLADKKAEEQAFVERSRDADGLLGRLEALSSLVNTNGTLKTAYLALLLFITAIEILPVLVKFLMNLGPPSLYDRVLMRSDQADVASAASRFAYVEEARKQEYEARLARHKENVDQIVARSDVEAARPRQATGRREHVRTPAQPQYRADGFAEWPDDESDVRARGGRAPSDETRWSYGK